MAAKQDTQLSSDDDSQNAGAEPRSKILDRALSFVAALLVVTIVIVARY